MRRKKLSSFLQKHCVTLLLCAVALALGFTSGWFAHVGQLKTEQARNFPYSVTHAAKKVATVQRLYGIRARANELADPISIMDLDIILMRAAANDLHDDLQALEIRHLKPYPEARAYIDRLHSYLLSANYTDYHSLEPTFTAAWPLMDSAGYHTIPEAMEALTERLATEEGQAAWELLDPTGLYRS